MLSPTEPNAKYSTRRATFSMFPDPEQVHKAGTEGSDTHDRACNSRAARSVLHQVPQQLVVAGDNAFGSENDIDNIQSTLSDLSL